LSEVGFRISVVCLSIFQRNCAPAAFSLKRLEVPLGFLEIGLELDGGLEVGTTWVSLEFTDVRNEGSERAERRMKRQKEQGSENVDDNPWPHALYNTVRDRKLR
jgi:hypothetical protein